MRKAHKVIVSLVLIAAAGVLLSMFWPMCSVFWSFDHLEQNARKRISGRDLQAWALGLLAQYPAETNFSSGRLGTNFPLRSLYHNPAYVAIFEEAGDTPAHVCLVWGGGVIGHCGFEIGPTNFVSYRRNARAWQPGVFFWSENPQR